MTLVFLLEERSMAAFLEGLLPRVLPDGVHPVLVPHEGKSDLERSIPRKLRGWKSPDTRFIVVRDQDSGSCKAIKQRLVELAAEGQRPDTLVRIACHELEAWFLGDLVAVAAAYERPTLARQQGAGKLAEPDRLGSPSRELAELVPGYQKVGGARRIAEHFDPKRCRSESFQVFLSGVLRVASAARGAGDESC